jgi:hypothetical protein
VPAVACFLNCDAWQANEFTLDMIIILDVRYCTPMTAWPPLWSSGQSSWLLTQRTQVRFLMLPDFLSSSGSGKGSTQPLWG